MKFGYIDNRNLAAVDWSLPANTPATQILLANLPQRTQPTKIYIGCSLWADRGLIGKLYPKRTAAQDYLKLYSQQFNTVELNATFYSIPSIAQVTKWGARVRPGFKFCPKVPRNISHSNNLTEQLARLNTFLEVILHLKENLGITFLQLSPYYSPNRMGMLQKLLEKVPQSLDWAVEFRHPAWFSDQVAQHEMVAFLQQRSMVAVISDVAARRDALHQTLTTSSTLIRFQGYAQQSNDYTRLDAWVARLQQWQDQGLHQIYFILHETRKALCVDLARHVIRKLNQRERLRLACLL